MYHLINLTTDFFAIPHYYYFFFRKKKSNMAIKTYSVPTYKAHASSGNEKKINLYLLKHP